MWPHNSFSGSICFEFSVLCLCNAHCYNLPPSILPMPWPTSKNSNRSQINFFFLAVFRTPQRVLNDLCRTRLSCSRMIKLLAHPLPHYSPVSNLSSLFLRLPVCRRSSLLTGEAGRRGGCGAKSYDRKKAWPSIKHSTLSEGTCLPSPLLYAPLFYVFLPTLKHLFWWYIRKHKLCKYWL